MEESCEKNKRMFIAVNTVCEDKILEKYSSNITTHMLQVTIKRMITVCEKSSAVLSFLTVDIITSK